MMVSDWNVIITTFGTLDGRKIYGDVVKGNGSNVVPSEPKSWEKKYPNGYSLIRQKRSRGIQEIQILGM